MCNRRTAAKKSEGEASTLVYAKPVVNFRTLTAFPMLHGARGFFHQSLYFPQGRHAMRLIIIDSRVKSRKIMDRSWMANPTRTPTRRPGREVIGARRLAYACQCLAPELPSIRGFPSIFSPSKCLRIASVGLQDAYQLPVHNTADP